METCYWESADVCVFLHLYVGYLERIDIVEGTEAAGFLLSLSSSILK